MEKYRNAEVKSFEFADLNGTHVVGQTQFESFEFKTLSGEFVSSTKISETDIRVERKFAEKNNFKIDAIVRDCRGLTRR
jgi:hypothetical protein